MQTETITTKGQGRSKTQDLAPASSILKSRNKKRCAFGIRLTASLSYLEVQGMNIIQVKRIPRHREIIDILHR
jgi:hypothetical protein